MNLIECLETLIRKGFDKPTQKHVFVFDNMKAATFFCNMICAEIDKSCMVEERKETNEYFVVYRRIKEIKLKPSV